MEKIKIEVKDNQEQVDVCIKKCSTQTSGGIQSIQEGIDIEVDSTDPLNPIVSYIGAASGGIQSVNSGTDISVDITDPLNPIVNFDGDFIPLSGTEVGSPVTGDIEISDTSLDQKRIYSEDGSIVRQLSFSDDGEIAIQSFTDDESSFSQLSFFPNGFFLSTYSSLSAKNITADNILDGIRIIDNMDGIGLLGDAYYGANYDDNTYVQKKYVDDNFAKITPNKRLVKATTSGTFNLNHSLYSDWKLTLTGATTLTDSNLPTGDYTIEFTMKITGSFGLTLPSYWSVNGDTYDGTKWNFFAVQVHKGDVGSEEVTVFITNLA